MQNIYVVPPLFSSITVGLVFLSFRVEFYNFNIKFNWIFSRSFSITFVYLFNYEFLWILKVHCHMLFINELRLLLERALINIQKLYYLDTYLVTLERLQDFSLDMLWCLCRTTLQIERTSVHSYLILLLVLLDFLNAWLVLWVWLVLLPFLNLMDLKFRSQWLVGGRKWHS